MLVLVSCKNESKDSDISNNVESKSTNDANNEAKAFNFNDNRQLKGDFIYYADAAVLQTPSEVYAVVIDSMMHELNDAVAEFKKEPTDMVPVAIRAKITPKPENEEGWENRIQILEIIKVYKPKPENNNVIKLEKKTN